MNDYKRTNSWSLLEQALKEATEIKTPELTIDLPHNQKLTIGQLKPDTIVEIATWKGSGAPDENSVRMLIGASLQNGAEMAAENEAVAAAVVADAVEEVVDAVSLAVPTEPEKLDIEPAAAVELDEKKLMGLGGPSSASTWEMVQKLELERTQKTQTPFQKELGRKQLRKMVDKKTLKFKLFSGLGGFLAAVLIIGGLNLTGLLAFDHPQVGPELPLGPATSSLIAIVPNSPAQPGDFAMAKIDGERNLVRVDAIDSNGYSISTMAGKRQIPAEQLDGKMSFLIPFIGAFWTILGQ